jgi:hypothetical protein
VRAISLFGAGMISSTARNGDRTHSSILAGCIERICPI